MRFLFMKAILLEKPKSRIGSDTLLRVKQNYIIILLVIIFLSSCRYSVLSSNNNSTSLIWYKYEPKEVYLTGFLKLEKGYGPPNYGADPAHDQRVSYYVLKLAAPINVKGDPFDEMNSETVKNVRVIQIVYDKLDRISKLKNKKVGIKGTLFKGFTGHHYTDILITVKEISLSK